MKCEKCGKNVATTHIHTVINGKVTDMHICGYCAKNHGIGRFGHLGLMNLLASVYDDTSINSKENNNTDRCNTCGASFGDIAGSGFIGCPDCYKFFVKQLNPTLKRIHGNSGHIGKIPSSAAPRLNTISKVEQLKRRLAEAIETENFELAATLRDRIREMEGGISK